MFHPSARTVVGGFAAARLAIGVAFGAAPDRLTRRPLADVDGTLMTRSFAVREVVLGVGGLLAVARARRRPSDLRLWAALGALTDGGDLGAALLGTSEDGSSTLVPAVVAAAGLVCELWALRPNAA